ncbi:MAG: zinc ABC transporter substrate-binding protein [Planctomycetaceae bacterium]
MLSLFLASQPGCIEFADHSSEPRNQSGPLEAAATVGMVADLVRIVGGDQVRVTQMMGDGVDPHLYRATRDDVRTIMLSDVVFYSGYMLEGRLTDTLRKTTDSTPSIAITSALAPDRVIHPPDSEGHADPHIWMDVSLWSTCVETIVKTLSDFRPSSRLQFEQRGEELQEELLHLHEYGKSVLGSVPEQQRVLITSHDAFRYFGRAYGLEVVGVQGLSTESEAGLQRINELVDMLVDRKVAAVFVESSVPRKNITALIDGAASRGQRVEIGGELFSDAMGPTGSWEGTYTGMMDHNFTSIARALGGTVPSGGFKGSLPNH